MCKLAVSQWLFAHLNQLFVKQNSGLPDFLFLGFFYSQGFHSLLSIAKKQHFIFCVHVYKFFVVAYTSVFVYASQKNNLYTCYANLRIPKCTSLKSCF